jgi:flagellar biosynthesis/type III secretory pathway protein FliH
VREVIALSVKIAERVVKRHGMQHSAMLRDNVAEALKLVIGMHRLRIAVHPSQHEVLADALPKLKLEFPTLEHAEIVEDDSLAPGGCRLMTRQGQIHADLDGQISRIAAELVPE